MRRTALLGHSKLPLCALVALATPSLAATSDGSLTVSTAGVVVNTYGTVSEPIEAGDTTR